MRANATPQLGCPDFFEERDVEKPQPGPGEVLVRVLAAGTNPVDTKLRVIGTSSPMASPLALGADISGVVEEVGAGVTDLAAGEEVYYTPEVLASPRGGTAHSG